MFNEEISSEIYSKHVLILDQTIEIRNKSIIKILHNWEAI